MSASTAEDRNPVSSMMPRFSRNPAETGESKKTEQRQCVHDLRDKTLALVEELYLLIPTKIGDLDDDSETEIGRWANVLSYVSENAILAAEADNLVILLQLYDIAKRAKAAMHCISNKPSGDHYCSKEMRHEIMMDIYRVEDRTARELLERTNGSPSMIVVLGVKSAAAGVMKWIGLPIVLYVLGSVALGYIQGGASNGPAFPLLAAVGDFLRSQFGPIALIFPWVAVAAFLGGLASVLTRLDDFEAHRGANPRLLFTNAKFKPFMGMILSFFVICVLAAQLVTVTGIELPADDKAASLKTTALLLALGFLSGFSERFAGDVVGSAEEILGKGKPKAGSKKER